MKGNKRRVKMPRHYHVPSMSLSKGVSVQLHAHVIVAVCVSALMCLPPLHFSQPHRLSSAK